MASIYSRYIPPAKPKNIDVPHISTVPESVKPSPLPAASPSPNSKPKSSANVEHKDSTPIATSKRKRDAVTLELQPGPVVKKAKKEKHEEKDKKNKSQKNPAPVVSLDKYAIEEKEPKHKAILEKRDKSMRKAEKHAKNAALVAKESGQDEGEPPAIEELHDLVPLPQPKPVPETLIQSATSSLPPWLASPIRVLPTDTANFADVGIQTDAAKILEQKGFKGAFAVQAAVLPILLPGKAQQQGDILVSAATGSGKTLAYVLPMVEDISHNLVTRLRGIIVMPTRELVIQAKEVCDICATAFSYGNRRRVKIGTAVGSENFKTEQASIMEQEDRYDPIQRRDQERRINRKWESSDWGSDNDADEILCDDEPISTLPDHVIDYISKIDILICTPGRLVEHLKSTPGFTLEYISWIVVDEADKLLDQTFQNWLDILMDRLDNDRKPQLQVNVPIRIRKCVLSATLTRDIGQLTGLKLFRPKLITLEGQTSHYENLTVVQSESGHVLPELLAESGIKVDEDNLKPLYLMEIISREKMVSHSLALPMNEDSSDDSSSDDDTSDDNTSIDKTKLTSHKAAVSSPPSKATRGVLIFTKSNESAVRLGRLLALLESKYANLIGTLTSTTRSSDRRSTIASFNSGKLLILVASDLVSRGLDLVDLAHVVNYDMPTSVTNYVHRVGRTARAGKIGSAWTLFTATEGRWFWNEIGRSDAIRRKEGSKIARVTIKADGFDKGLRSRYEAALEELGKEASSKTAKPKKAIK